MRRRATVENGNVANHLPNLPAGAHKLVSGTYVSSSGLGFDTIGNLLGYASANSHGLTDASLKFVDVIGHDGSLPS
jgi:hypothetical protein